MQRRSDFLTNKPESGDNRPCVVAASFARDGKPVFLSPNSNVLKTDWS